MPQPPEPPGRTAASTRIVSPDLARGLTLLGIALANVGTAWVESPDAQLAEGLGGVYDDNLLDQIAVVLGTMFVHVRGLPMFATLLGLGVGMITMSLWRRGYPSGRARWVIVRRYGLLALIGALHMVLLFYGDIMFFYGLAGMVMAALISLRDKVLLWIAGVLLALQAIGFTALGLVSLVVPEIGAGFAGGGFLSLPESYPENIALGGMTLFFGLVGFLPQALIFLPLLLLGFVAARRGVFTDVRSHRRSLLTWVGLGVAVILLVGLPWGLAEIGVLPVTLAPALQMINTGLGMLTGPAIIAAIALLSQPLQDRINCARERGERHRPGILLRSLVALGRRSMTGYVLQSVFFLVLLMPFALNLGQGVGAFGLSLIALGVWLLTLLIAAVLDQLGRPGPLEYLHRLLSYGRTGLAHRWVPPAQHRAEISTNPAEDAWRNPGEQNPGEQPENRPERPGE